MAAAKPGTGRQGEGVAAMLEELDVDSLLREIALSQQRLEERRKAFQEAHLEASLYHEKIIDVTEKIQEAKSVLEEKVVFLIEKEIHKDLLLKRQESFMIQKDKLLKERRELHYKQQVMKKEIDEEEEKFMKELQDFNTNYSLTSNRAELLQEKSKAEGQRLDVEVALLKKDLEEEISAAVSTTRSLQEEKVLISQKPQNDAECLRLKKELELYKNDDLKDMYESLCTEIDFLQQMLLTWVFAVAFLAVVQGAEVCYDRVGCFSDVKPWAGTIQRPLAKLPWSTSQINTRFLLYTRSNLNSYQTITATNPSSISSSNFRTSRKTRFIIHGFTDSGTAAWLSDICKKLLGIEDVNCICVDWSGGSRTGYTQASNNIRVVGSEVAYFLQVLSNNFGYSPANVHLIGHSLGAHTAGEAGKRFRGVARITGLDPAEPYFQDTPTEVRLDPSDATLVDVIHTDTGPLVPSLGFGMSQVVGHLDFFPNGGVHMPGCPQNIEIPNVNVDDIWNGVINFVTCNHMRAIKYYTDSIGNTAAFASYPCANWNTYQAGSCKSCPSAGCPKMGHYADTYRGVTGSSQVFYLTTP
ncbi:pancreatic triacylglycerol lipase-like isoform X2 [Hyperolius riggenbachi]|uniref:pancreatic triacylglycerol lipase-like isoform X2 n=1 Tax=Hyperolius riggenbachi TaxID=752182 RepID=UPI0035A2DD23